MKVSDRRFRHSPVAKLDSGRGRSLRNLSPRGCRTPLFLAASSTVYRRPGHDLLSLGERIVQSLNLAPGV